MLHECHEGGLGTKTNDLWRTSCTKYVAPVLLDSAFAQPGAKGGSGTFAGFWCGKCRNFSFVTVGQVHVP
jgi:hypothetical protein